MRELYLKTISPHIYMSKNMKYFKKINKKTNFYIMNKKCACLLWNFTTDYTIDFVIDMFCLAYKVTFLISFELLGV